MLINNFSMIVCSQYNDTKTKSESKTFSNIQGTSKKQHTSEQNRPNPVNLKLGNQENNLVGRWIEMECPSKVLFTRIKMVDPTQQTVKYVKMTDNVELSLKKPVSYENGFLGTTFNIKIDDNVDPEDFFNKYFIACFVGKDVSNFYINKIAPKYLFRFEPFIIKNVIENIIFNVRIDFRFFDCLYFKILEKKSAKWYNLPGKLSLMFSKNLCWFNPYTYQNLSQLND
ncbi:hypothetical protein NUSPORA_00521 [Nucleospora cyclopteri]